MIQPITTVRKKLRCQPDLLELNALTFPREGNIQGRSMTSSEPFELALEKPIVMLRVVMEYGELLHPGFDRVVDHRIECAVTPSPLGLIFFGGVLRLADQQAGAAREVPH